MGMISHARKRPCLQEFRTEIPSKGNPITSHARNRYLTKIPDVRRSESTCCP